MAVSSLGRPGRQHVGGVWSGPLAVLIKLLSVLAAATCVVWLIGNYQSLRNDSFRSAYQIVASMSICGLLVFVPLFPGKVWSAAGAYLCVFWLFHFGLITSIAFSPDREISDWNSRWITGPDAVAASVLSLLGMLAFSAGALIVNWRGSESPPRSIEASRVDRLDRFDSRMTQVGAAILVVCVLAWLTTVFKAGGLAVLTGAYTDYLSATEQAAGLITWIWLGIGFGCVVVATAGPSRARRIGRAFLAIFAVLALPLGLRGEVLFPAVSAGVVLTWHGRPVSSKLTLAMVAVGLMAIAAIREIRAVGVGAIDLRSVEVTPWEALEELGGSLQPVERVVAWRREGDPFALGATYWAPFDRTIRKVVPGLTRPPAENDDRIMNVLIAKRIGPIGFSPVAEAYRNFGQIGVLGVMFAIGLLLGSLDARIRTRFGQLVGAAIYVPMLINVRNSFISVPSQVLIGVTVVLLVRRMASPPYQRDRTASHWTRTAMPSVTAKSP